MSSDGRETGTWTGNGAPGTAGSGAKSEPLEPRPDLTPRSPVSGPPSATNGLDEIPFVPRNYWAWVGYQLFYRIGWQFKMEATMVAGLVSYLSGSAAVMGLFTTVNTLARTVAPLFAVGWVDARPRKRDVLLFFWVLATLAWAAGAAFLWTPAARARHEALLWFLGTYTLFMVLLGCSSVAQGTLLGKVIPVTMRGRSLSVSASISGPVNVVAIFIVYALVRAGWFPAPRNYAFAFSLTIFFFVLAGLAVAQIRESPSPPLDRRRGLGANVRYLRQLVASDPNLRLLVLVNLTTSLDGSIIGFYTTYGRLSGAISDATVVLATVLQVLSQSISSGVLGRVVDRRGNRVVICSLLWAQAVNPLVALACVSLPALHGSQAYLAVYILIGTRFPIFQLLTNYLLEVIPMEEHARALGAMSTLMILTTPMPVLLGLLADAAGFAPVMLLASSIMFAGAAIAPRLKEPRTLG